MSMQQIESNELQLATEATNHKQSNSLPSTRGLLCLHIILLLNSWRHCTQDCANGQVKNQVIRMIESARRRR
uniref:Uncharacterized protein n=1 Tax=Peronospora matthiolae TaxID=2874970 RepID=A0AAV1VD12_9STRA